MKYGGGHFIKSPAERSWFYGTFEEGKTYKIYTNGTYTEGTVVNGVYSGGSYNGTEYATITISGTVTTHGSGGGMNPGGNFGGGGMRPGGNMGGGMRPGGR